MEHLEEVVGVVQGNFPRHRDVCQRLLQGEDVATHPVDDGLVYRVQVLSGTHENLGYQVAYTFKHILQQNRNIQHQDKSVQKAYLNVYIFFFAQTN